MDYDGGVILQINTGFFQSDLNVFHYRRDGKHSGDFPKVSVNEYDIFWIIEGEAEYKIDKATYTLKKNDLAIAMPNENRSMTATEGPFESINISFHPFIFHQPEGDDNLMRAFTDRPVGEACIFHPESFDDNNCISALFGIKKCLSLHAGRVHIAANLLTVISELCFFYDKTHPAEKTPVSDNVSVKILVYIKTHFCENISLEKICKKFFVSASTVNNVAVSNTGLSFWSYVTFLRLQEAQRLIKLNYKLKTVADLCGFGDYSSFYRAYRKHYGHSPKHTDFNELYDEYKK